MINAQELAEYLADYKDYTEMNRNGEWGPLDIHTLADRIGIFLVRKDKGALLTKC